MIRIEDTYIHAYGLGFMIDRSMHIQYPLQSSFLMLKNTTSDTYDFYNYFVSSDFSYSFSSLIKN